MPRDSLSSDSIEQASKSQAEFSGHGDAAGAAGHRPDQGIKENEFLSKRGQAKLIIPPEGGFGRIDAGLAWNNVIRIRAEGLLNRFVKKAKKEGVDLDLGCLYELKNGQRGAVQAFGEMFGAYEAEPFIALSGDERTGDAAGDDEVLSVNGDYWSEVKRMLIYAYVYQGPTMWSEIEPKLTIRFQDHQIRVSVDADLRDMNICALVLLENHKEGIQATNISEYFPAHPAMDRAFGFGLKWAAGEKS